MLVTIDPALVPFLIYVPIYAAAFLLFIMAFTMLVSR